MSRFYVGQRVRIVDAALSKFLIGTETTVVELDATGVAGGLTYIGTKCAAINIQGRHFIARDGQLEPITDSYDVTSWDTCVWKPEHLMVGA